MRTKPCAIRPLWPHWRPIATVVPSNPVCSIGVLTAKLAVICDHVLAMDIAPTAVDQARARCREFKNVEVVCGALPQDLPQGSLDLIVLSEVGYYLSEDRLQTLGKSLVQKCRRAGYCSPCTGWANRRITV